MPTPQEILKDVGGNLPPHKENSLFLLAPITQNRNLLAKLKD